MSDQRQWVELDPSNGTGTAKPQDGQSAATTTAPPPAQPAEPLGQAGPDGSPDR